MKESTATMTQPSPHNNPLPLHPLSLLQHIHDSYTHLLHTRTFEEYATEDTLTDDYIAPEHTLWGVLQEIFPIQDFNGELTLSCTDLHIHPPLRAPKECIQHKQTYSQRVDITLHLHFQKEDAQENTWSTETTLPLTELPCPTPKGSFIIKGVEKVLSPRLHPSPGAYLTREERDNQSTIKAQVAPLEGTLLEWTLTPHNTCKVTFDRRHPIPAVDLLRATGQTAQNILTSLYPQKTILIHKERSDTPYLTPVEPEQLIGQHATLDIKDTAGKVIVPQGRSFGKHRLGLRIRLLQRAGLTHIPIRKEALLGQYLAKDVHSPTKQTCLASACDQLTDKHLRRFEKHGVTSFTLAHTTPETCFLAEDIHQTLQTTQDQWSPDTIRSDLYKRIRKGDPPTQETADRFFEQLFLHPSPYKESHYFLSKRGRDHLNERIKYTGTYESMQLTPEDLFGITRLLIQARAPHTNAIFEDLVFDDLNHMKHWQVVLPGALIAQQCKKGLEQTSRYVRERLSMLQHTDIPEDIKDLVSFKHVDKSLQEIFRSKQWSQPLHTHNPLASLHHLRQLDARRTFKHGFRTPKTKDYLVHPSQLGRLCPFTHSTPPGLKFTPALTTQPNLRGILHIPLSPIKTPQDVTWRPTEKQYRHVRDTQKTTHEQLGYSDQAFKRFSTKDTTHTEVSDYQQTSPAASLIPFAGHLSITSTEQAIQNITQAIPLLHPTSPIVQTGTEQFLAQASRHTTFAPKEGTIQHIDDTSITLLIDETQTSIQRTTLETGPYSPARLRVKPGQQVHRGDVLCDVPGIKDGTIALGHNLITACLPWDGFNTKEQLLVSERVIQSDAFTSVHIEEITCTLYDTTYGPERILLTTQHTQLDPYGIIPVGSHVHEGDLLVAKRRPTQETRDRMYDLALSDEDKKDEPLLTTGEDASLHLPPGMSGTVIKISIQDSHTFSRDDDTLSYYERTGLLDEHDKPPARHKLGKSVLRRVTLHIACKRPLREGDKLGNRHGLQGRIAHILPQEEMPALSDGTPVDIIMHPLAFATHKAPGMLYELQTAWAAKQLGLTSVNVPFSETSTSEIYTTLLEQAGLSKHGKLPLFDGRTGTQQNAPTGLMYWMKVQPSDAYADKTTKLPLIQEGVYTYLPGEHLLWSWLSHHLHFNIDEVYASSPETSSNVPKLTQLAQILFSLGWSLQQDTEDGFQSVLSLESPTPSNTLRLGFVSDEDTLSRSFGEVTKPETINARTKKPERDGLFCARIFGPIQDYTCICGKYKGTEHKDLTCEKCGVEIISLKARQHRFGHIRLATPILRMGYIKHPLKPLQRLLCLSTKEVQDITSSILHVVTRSEDTSYPKGTTITEDAFYSMSETQDFTIETGAAALYTLLEDFDLRAFMERCEAHIQDGTTQKEQTWAKRLALAKQFADNNISPLSMFTSVIPVIPPALRTEDWQERGTEWLLSTNDLYRRLLNRNNRLKRLIELNAPEIIIRNEQRMLQEACDALFDNARCKHTLVDKSKRPLISLTDLLQRYSSPESSQKETRALLSIGFIASPSYSLTTCGLPVQVAATLYEQHHPQAPSWSASSPQEWSTLEAWLQERVILIQSTTHTATTTPIALRPSLCEGHQLRLHPLTAALLHEPEEIEYLYIHMPSSSQAQQEARTQCSPIQQLWSQSDRTLRWDDQTDLFTSLAYLTAALDPRPPVMYTHHKQALYAYEHGQLSLHRRVHLKQEPPYHPSIGLPEQETDDYVTTVGRLLLMELWTPYKQVISLADLPMWSHCASMRHIKRHVSEWLTVAHSTLTEDALSAFITELYHIAITAWSRSAFSLGLQDLSLPEAYTQQHENTQNALIELKQQQKEALITEQEYTSKYLDIWSHHTTQCHAQLVHQYTETIDFSAPGTWRLGLLLSLHGTSSAYPWRDLLIMCTHIPPQSEYHVDLPVTKHLLQGLRPTEKSLLAHERRLQLTHKEQQHQAYMELVSSLFTALEPLHFGEEDCGTAAGIDVEYANVHVHFPTQTSFVERVQGRRCAEDIIDDMGVCLASAGERLTALTLKRLEQSGIQRFKIRSPLTCDAKEGICRYCAPVGDDSQIGHRAAQTYLKTCLGLTRPDIGERLHQQVRYTEHTLSANIPEGTRATVSLVDCIVGDNLQESIDPETGLALYKVSGRHPLPKIRLSFEDNTQRDYLLFEGYTLYVQDGAQLTNGDVLATLPDTDEQPNAHYTHPMTSAQKWLSPASSPDAALLAPVSGEWRFCRSTQHHDIFELVEQDGRATSIRIPRKSSPLFPHGAFVQQGEALTTGLYSAYSSLEAKGKARFLTEYLNRMQRVFTYNNCVLQDLYLECILRQLFSLVEVVESGDTMYHPKEVVTAQAIQRASKDQAAMGGCPAVWRETLMSVKDIALRQGHFLSSLSSKQGVERLLEIALRGEASKIESTKEKIYL